MDEDLSEQIASLNSEDSARRLAAAERLAQLGRDARPAAVALVRVCQVEDESTRELAAAALEDLGPPLPEHVAQLAELLKHPSRDAAYWASTLLGRLAAQAEPAVTGLIEALADHPEPAVRQRAAWALGQIGPGAAAARGALQQAAAGADRRLARLAAEALRSVSR